MINKILRRLKLKEPETYKNYKNDLEVYFKTLDITYNEAESNLKNKLGDDILFFKNTKGQQLEALIFSAISLSNYQFDNILEIGTGSGANTSILAKLFPDAKVYTYDLPRDDIDYESMAWRKKDANFNKRINEKNINFFTENSFFMAKNNMPKFDLIYVDGGHSYPAIAWDGMYAYNHSNKNAFIVFHDYNRPNNDPRIKNSTNDIKDFIDNYFIHIIPEKVHFLPWAGYDPHARICLVQKEETKNEI
jgi:predicted O-methyltransferase YrrM